jgi:hypothetical protein
LRLDHVLGHVQMREVRAEELDGNLHRGLVLVHHTLHT